MREVLVGDFGARMCETFVWLLQWGITMGTGTSAGYRYLVLLSEDAG